MMTDRNGKPMESELAVRARAESACNAEFERITASALDMPWWLSRTFLGGWLSHYRLMKAYRVKVLVADRIMSLDMTVGIPHQKLAKRLLEEAMRVRKGWPLKH
jgi:hypothetical protein